MQIKERGRRAGLTQWAPRVLSAIVVSPITGSGQPASAAQAALPECPYVKPMHGLMPMLFKIGLLPQPPLATTIAASDTSTSVVIRPNSAQQIECGAIEVSVIHDVAFAHPTLSNGKAKSIS